jgi:hypothetical protein
MAYRLGAELVLMLHLGFVLFVVAGAFVAWRGRRWLVAHLAALAWGAGIEFTGLVCPLTWLEHYLRTMAGASGYAGGFVEHYLLAVLYPAGLTRAGQMALGCAVLGINGLLYGWLTWRHFHAQGRPLQGGPA